MKAGPGASLATKPFVLLCVAMFLGYANQWVLTPIIPLYVHDLGGSAFVAGLALLAFAIPSFTVRPLVGSIADRWSAAGVLAVGLGCLAAGTLLALLPMLSMLFIGNVVRGLGWAGVNTGGYTTLAIAAPASRRGEAAGYYSSVTTSVSIAFPALGLWLMSAGGGVQSAFAVSTLMALLGVPVAWMLMRKEPARAAAGADAAGAEGAPFVERGVLLATALNLCSTLAAPSVMAFLPLYARTLGIANIGWFYVLAGITSIVIRPLLGKKSDAIGRGPAIAVGLTAQLAGLALIISADGIGLILVGGFFVAVGQALIGSTTTALAMDLANPRSRGRSMASYSISYQIGAGVGSMIAGALADLVGLKGMYVGSMVMIIAGFALLANAWKSLPRPPAAA